MAYSAKTPEQILKDAAAAAEQLLPAAEAERDAAQRTLAEAEAKINRFRLVISAAQSTPSVQSNLGMTTTVVSTGTSTFSVTSLSTAPAFAKVATVLSTGEGYTTRQIADQYKNEFHSPIPQSTLYAVLNKGRQSGQFIEEDGKWSLTKKST